MEEDSKKDIQFVGQIARYIDSQIHRWLDTKIARYIDSQIERQIARKTYDLYYFQDFLDTMQQSALKIDSQINMDSKTYNLYYFRNF